MQLMVPNIAHDPYVRRSGDTFVPSHGVYQLAITVIMSSQEALVVGVVEIAYYNGRARGVHIFSSIGVVM